MNRALVITDETVVNKIYLIRGKRVMMDRDLAEMYGVETRVLNQSVKRNEKRFPEDFMFQLTAKELNEWKSQITVGSKERMGLRKLPLVFTEQGVAMLSSVLNSETAIEVNIRIIRVFTKMREMLLTNKDILLKLEKMERKILKQDNKLNKHEKEMQIIFKALKELLNPPTEPMRKIGFRHTKED
jgi:phage regulator Rha-like protein